MFRRNTETLDKLHESAMDWRGIGLATLEQDGIQQAIGPEKAERLHKLCHGAGTLLVDKERISKTRSRNGLYIIPLHEGIPRSTEIDIPRGWRRKYTLPVGIMAHEHPTSHASIEGLEDMHFVGLPIESPHLSTHTERAAVIVHELTHADQFGRNIQGYHRDDARTATLHEAEAYTDQYHVINYFLGGSLDSIVDANRNNEDLYVIEVGRHPARTMIDESYVVTNALSAVIRNTVHGYQADGSSLPSATLAVEYGLLNLIDD